MANALTNTTKMANRLGLDIEFYAYAADGTVSGDKLAEIKFANEVSLELTSSITWATGGQTHAKMIGFKDPTEGTLKISTQVVNMQMITLASGGDIATAGKKVSFKNDSSAVAPKYYIIKGKTVWQGEDGTTYSETITAYKACVKPGYNVTYNGSGDPQSLDIEFELGTNEAGQVVDIGRDDVAAE